MLCAAANPSVDTTFVVDRLDAGAIHRATAFLRVAGGKGLNVARAARRLGSRPEAVALAPEHGSSWLVSELEREGIELELLRTDGQVRRCLSVFAASTGTLTEFYEDGEPVAEASWRAYHEAVVARARPGKWVVLAGSLPPGAPEDACAELARACALAGASVALDADGAALVAGLAAGPDLVKVNEAEARTALGADPTQVADTAGALELASGLRALASQPAPVAIVTRGERGAVLAGDGLAIAAEAPASSGHYPVGSGDAFLAGFLTRSAAGADHEDALRLALAAGAANAEQLGPGCIDPDWTERTAERVRITRS